ncbi:MAG TPA: gamma-glutamyltransferase [Acidimicrobiales bacterium]|nr:gamma-glutamyltransferase [Acidimicrobiales bacterium]
MAWGCKGAVSAPHLFAAQAAIDVLRSGGNAVDAAVAAAAVSTVVQPFSSSAGGVGWATVYDRALQKTEVLQFHGAVPAGLDPDCFSSAPSGLVDWKALEAAGKALLGSLVPGTVAGWAELLARKGRWSLARALEIAASLAFEGFPVSELLHEILKQNMGKLSRWPASARIFLPHGRLLVPGERLVQADLGSTLERIGNNGPAEVVAGQTGEALVDLYCQYGGVLSASDLSAYRPMWYQPLVTTFRGHVVHAAPAPLGDVSFVSGLSLLEALSDRAGSDYQWSGCVEPGPGHAGPLDPAYVSASVESAKIVNAERRRYLGPGAGKATVDRLLGADHVRALSERVALRASGGPMPPSADEHTITLAVVDEDGNAANIMQTVGTFFGTGAVAEGTGVLANSCLYFAYAGNKGANRVVPGRGIEQNPCLITVFDRDGNLELVLGSPGGRTRVETVRQMLVNVLDFGMNIQQAVDAPRFLSGADGKSVDFEHRYGPLAPELCAALEARGYAVRYVDDAFGSGQAVAIDPVSRTRMAAADWRRESVALAY